MPGEGPVDAVYREIRSAAARFGVGESATAEPAAAVCLWRSTGKGLELLLVERGPELAFLGGYWTFPGGRVEPGESAAEAAARELREETGVAVDPASLTEAGRFVTPELSPRRFDARYFLAEAPPEAPAPDVSGAAGEVVSAAWVRPDDVIARFRRGEWLVPSPVERAVRALRAGASGAPARIARAAEEEAAAPRLWPIAEGAALSPLATPTLPPATHTNCYVFGTRELVVVDPATPYEAETAELDRALEALLDRGAELRAIWLTHHHLDHVGAAGHLAERFGAPVAAHAETASRLEGVVRVDELLDDGDRLRLGGDPPRTLRAVFTPGHAPGHLCFLEEETGLLAAGDMVAGVGTILIDPSEGDMAQYLESLGRMRRLGPRRLLPAHGGVIADPGAKIEEYVRHRLWREDRVLQALGEHGPGRASELVGPVYADVPPALHPLAERSLTSHLLKLEAEGRARRDGEVWKSAG